MSKIGQSIIEAQDNNIDLPSLAVSEQAKWFRKQLAYQKEQRRKLAKYDQ
jgi:hypothetical protein